MGEHCKVCDPENVAKYLLFESELSVCIASKFPLNQCHVVILPKRHEEEILRLTVEESRDLLDTAWQALLMFQALGLQATMSMNLGEDAGQTVKHVHFVVLARYRSDGITNTNRYSIDGRVALKDEVDAAGVEQMRELLNPFLGKD